MTLTDETVFILKEILIMEKNKMKLNWDFLEELERLKQECINQWYETKEDIAEAMFLHINIFYPIPITKGMIDNFLDDLYEPF